MNDHYYVIDASYIIYYSANSAFAQYVRDNDIVNEMCTPDFDPTTDPEYLYLLERKFLRCIERPVQQVIPFIDKSRYIFCLDCPRKNIWRRNIYPQYKIQRDTKDKSKDKFNIGTSFNYVYTKVIPDLCSEWNANQLKCNFAEGDDCIAVVTNYILNQNKFNKVIIVSADKDMVQLYNKRTTIITTDGTLRKPKEEMEKMLKLKIEDDIDSDDFLLWKIIMGDGSDGIPNIKEKVGPKKAFLLLQNKDELKKLLTEDINIAKAFKRNKTLISMHEIPTSIQELILDDVKHKIFKDDEVINDLDLI